MFRTEQMANLAGAMVLERDQDGSAGSSTRATWSCRDAVLIDVGAPGRHEETYVGTIAAGATVTVNRGRQVPGRVVAAKGLDPELLLREFRSYMEDRPENQGEIRLVGWSPRPYGGLKLAPAVDRHRGFGVVVVHLRSGPPPAPGGPSYSTVEAEAK